MALDEPAPHEVIDHPARGGQRHEHGLSRLLQRQLVLGALEVMQQLDLGQRQIERPNRLE